MPDELYQRQPSQVGPGLSHHMEPVGFTLADVRRLARVVGTLKEKNDAQ
jgi:hypothetical protein